MSGGELRESVAFDARNIMSDGYGNEITGDFAQQFVVPARIWPQKGTGNEAIAAARLTGQQPMVIRVRMSAQTSQITTAWRARDTRRGTIYNIRSMANMDERNAYLDILAQSGEASG
jgi:head-tail adaptor